MRPLARVLAIAAVLVSGRTAIAQRLSGVVHNGATGEPVIGALVTISAGDSTFSRVFSRAGGAFQVTVSSGAQRLQVRRIGFTPVDLDISAAVGGSDVTRMIVDLTPIPALLDASVSRARGGKMLEVLIADGSRCPRTNGAAEALELWEQAQIGFIATAAVRFTSPPLVTAFRYVQRARDGTVNDHAVRVVAGTALGTFAAHRTANEFASLGYAGFADNALVFYGLDVNVLLDRMFLFTHCFSVAKPNAAQPGRVGIDFVPAPGREAVIEVSGTVWLDRSPLALATMEFRYEGLGPRGRSAASGGSIAFRTADNGITMIDAWQLRLPEGVTRRLRATDTTIITRDMLVIAPNAQRNVLVEGAELKAAHWQNDDTTTVTRTFTTVQGTVVGSNGRPAAGMHVELLASPYRGVTDSAGRFAMTDVIAGPYTVVAYDTTWSGFDEMGRVDQRITADGRKPVSVSLRVPRPGGDAPTLCGATFPERGPVALEIQPTDPRLGSRRPIGPAVRVTVEVSVARDGRTRNAPIQSQTTLGSMVRLCGAYPGNVTVKVTAADGRRAELTIPVAGARVTPINIAVR